MTCTGRLLVARGMFLLTACASCSRRTGWRRSATPKTEMLWPNGAPGAQSAPRTRTSPRSRSICRPSPRRPARASSICPGGGYGGARDGSRGPPGGALAHVARRRGVHPEVPPRPALPPSGDAAGRAAGHPRRAIARRPVQHQGRPRRHHGLLGRRPSRVLGGDAVRPRRTARSPTASETVSSRPDFAVLAYPVILMGRRQSRTRARSATCSARTRRPSSWRELSTDQQVTAGHAADVHLPHRRRHRRAGREQRAVLPRAAEGRRARGTAHLREGRARRRPGARQIACCRTWTDRLLGWLRVNGFIQDQ